MPTEIGSWAFFSCICFVNTVLCLDMVFVENQMARNGLWPESQFVLHWDRSRACRRRECDNSDDYEVCSTTPIANESRILGQSACPPAPRKRCLLPRVTTMVVREFFNPPDSESVFIQPRIESKLSDLGVSSFSLMFCLILPFSLSFALFLFLVEANENVLVDYGSVSQLGRFWYLEWFFLCNDLSWD